MEHTVTLTNCNQKFLMRETETILEAAIRAGISLGYGCTSGTCGLCKARLVSGQVREIKPRVYAIPESEKLQGHILTCVNTASEDIVLDAMIASSASDIPLQEMDVKVRKVDQVTAEVYRLFVQTPRTNRLRFLAGQFAELSVPNIGTGNYAIASCPCEDRLIEFHVRVVENDPFAELVSKDLKIGDSLQLRGPFGEFVFDENANRPVILFAFDTGFAAIKSLLEHITAEEQELSIHLIWMSCGEDGLYMNNLCRSWKDAFDTFTYTGVALEASLKQLVDNPELGRATVESHMRDAMKEHDDLSAYDIYTCAPVPATTIFEQLCMQKKALAGRFFAELVRGNEDMTCIVSLQHSVE